jgi:hypothetical protein
MTWMTSQHHCVSSFSLVSLCVIPAVCSGLDWTHDTSWGSSTTPWSWMHCICSQRPSYAASAARCIAVVFFCRACPTSKSASGYPSGCLCPASCVYLFTHLYFTDYQKCSHTNGSSVASILYFCIFTNTRF